MWRHHETNRYLRAQLLRRHGTAAERQAWELLRNRRLLGLKFRRQHPLGYGVVVDFYCPALRLALEIDGEIHTAERQRRRDAQRTQTMATFGVRLIRIRNDQLDAGTLTELIRPLLRR